MESHTSKKIDSVKDTVCTIDAKIDQRQIEVITLTQFKFLRDKTKSKK